MVSAISAVTAGGQQNIRHMQPDPTPLRLFHGVGTKLFGTLKCERRLAGALLQVEHSDSDNSICDVTLQGSPSDCCTAVLQILHHASAAHAQNTDWTRKDFAQAAWQLKHQDNEPMLSAQQMSCMPPDALASTNDLCLHLPSSCLLPLKSAIECCQVLCQGQTFWSETASIPCSSLSDHEDKDGDVVMAEEEVEQLIESLQAARHDSREWDHAAGHATISMLLYGHQAGHEQEPTAMDFALTKPGGVRLYVVVDTSVLLSHWSFIQALHRNLGEDGAVPAEQAGTPGVQVLLVVPWAVLVELDKLKAEHSVLRIPGGKRGVAPLARRAIKGLATMLTTDSCLHYQSEADAVKANKEFGVTGKKVLNDDSIIHCAMNIQRRMQEAHLQGDLEASKSGAVLLTKDNNMGLKAQANNLKALSPAHFPAAQPHLHKQLLSISSDTSPVKHSQPPQDSPGSSPRRPRGLFMEPPEALASLTASAPNSFSKQVQLAEASGSGQVGEGSHSCLPWPGNPTDNSSSSAAISRMLSARNRSPPVDQVTQQQQQQQQQQQLPPDQRSQSQQSQQALQQALQDYQQQQQQQQEAVIHGSLFRLQESPMVHPGMVTGSHGYPRAPSTTATHLLPGTGPVGMQQPQLGSQSGIPVGVVSMNGSMQHQQGGFPGNVLHPQISNGRGNVTSMGNTLAGDTRMPDVRCGLESASSLGGASSTSAEAAQELSEKLWQVLIEGVQPFMQWELQSGMGDFWEQAISRAPPWDVADMLAVMKKDMSSSLHSNADLSRSHARLQAALKLRDRPTSLSALADLASHVSTMLLMLPLPAKSDTVAHVRSGAVTGLKARLALQKGREDVQRLSKLLQQSLQQQQQQQPPLRTPSFPPRGGPGPIGPSTKLAQAATSVNQGQSRRLLQAHASNGALSTAQPSATLDPIFVGQQLRHARQPSPQPGLPNESPLAYLSNAFASPAVWQQESVQQQQQQQQQQRAASPALSIGASYMGQALGSYMPAAQQAINRSWSGGGQPGQSVSVNRSVPNGGEENGANGLTSISGRQDRNGAANRGLDPLQSAQGLLQAFGKFAAEHLHKLQSQLQEHPGDVQTAEQVFTSAHTIKDAAKLLLHAVAIVHTSEPPQHQVDVVKRCAQKMLAVVFWVLDQQQALPPLRPMLVGDLCHFFTNPEGAQAAANLAQQLQHTAASVVAA